MANNIDVKILKSSTGAIWKIDAQPLNVQYSVQGEHHQNKFWCFTLNDRCFITTRSRLSSQYFCSAAILTFWVSVEYWWFASIISKSFYIIEASVNILIAVSPMSRYWSCLPTWSIILTRICKLIDIIDGLERS